VVFGSVAVTSSPVWSLLLGWRIKEPIGPVMGSVATPQTASRSAVAWFNVTGGISGDHKPEESAGWG